MELLSNATFNSIISAATMHHITIQYVHLINFITPVENDRY